MTFWFLLFVCLLLLFCISELILRSAASKYGSLHPTHELKLLKAFLIDVFFELPVQIAQSGRRVIKSC